MTFINVLGGLGFLGTISARRKIVCGNNQVRSLVKTKTDALDCALLQTSGTKFGFGQNNEEIARQATAADPIMQFCR